MCCVSFAFANEVETERDSPKNVESVEKKNQNDKKVKFRMECFGLSCGTVCGDLSGSYTGQAYVNLWYALEWQYCINIV